jgi:hypothetical protein
MIKFRLCGQLHTVRVDELRRELTRIMANFGRGAMTQATE